jgi:serine/threonine protein kinase
VRSYKDDRFIYFTIPFFPGHDLDQIIKANPPLNICVRLRIFVDLITEVNKMHAKGILHRDLKAPNVIVNLTDNRVEVNIIDFGRSVCVFSNASGKAVATPEDLSLRNTVTHSHSLFHPFWQMVRKLQSQTAPEYTALISHLYNYSHEAESVGFRSDYYSLATLFQRLVPEHARIAIPVIYTEGFHRNDAYHQFVESARSLLARYEKLYSEFDGYAVMSERAKNTLSSLHM